jgi:hypothetical protein
MRKKPCPAKRIERVGERSKERNTHLRVHLSLRPELRPETDTDARKLFFIFYNLEISSAQGLWLPSPAHEFPWFSTAALLNGNGRPSHLKDEDNRRAENVPAPHGYGGSFRFAAISEKEVI